MSLGNTLVDVLETLIEFRCNLLLITNTKILEVEWFGVTSLGTHLSPLVGSWVAICPLNQVDSLGYPLVHLAHRHYVLSLFWPHVPTTVSSLTAHTCRQDGHGLHTKILTELEVLEITETTALVISPGILKLAALLLGADSGLPAIGIPETIATTVNYTTTRESHELRIQVGQCLSQILTQAVALISILGHKRNNIDIHITIVKCQDIKRSLLAS